MTEWKHQLFAAMIVIGLLLAGYHVTTSKNKQLLLLKQLDIDTEAKLDESIPGLRDPIRKETISELKFEMDSEVTKELDAAFVPDKRQDNSMKLELKYMLREDIQKTVTNDLREELKIDTKKLINDVIKEGFSEDPKYPQNLCSSDKNLPPGQKVLAYTVFGTRAHYYEGIPVMLREASASSLYGDWLIRIYHDALITPEIIASYKEYKNLHFCDARKLPVYGDQTKILGKFWRNLPIADPTVDVFCSRDLDSALLTREEAAVRDWLKSDKILHSMRDFEQHMVGILAGMWCFRPEYNRTMGKNFVDDLLERAKTYDRKTDQPLLNAVIWDSILDKPKYTMQHDSFHCKMYEGSIPFPTKREDNSEFVGCPGHVCSWKNMDKCPVECRPKDHQDWEYC